MKSAPSHEPDRETPVLQLAGIRKTFGAVVALHGIDFAARAGEIHAIVGENGAGKSTLISIAAGILEASAGEIRIAGEAVQNPDVLTMRRHGVSVANQHPALAPDLTVRENFLLVRPDLEDGEVRSLLQRVTTESLAIDPDERVADLILARRHMVEIARALVTRPRILIFDEPTEPFQEEEVAKLFDLIRSLRDEGTAIVYISHRLNEVMHIADRISVLRDGRMIDTRQAAEYTPGEIVTLIAGRPLDQVFPPKPGDSRPSAPVLDVSGLIGPGVHGVDLVLGPGEIVGLTGVEGQGQREFIRCLAGIAPRTSGEIRINGEPFTGDGVSASRAAGFGFVPDDRHSEGLFLPDVDPGEYRSRHLQSHRQPRHRRPKT